MQTLRGLAPRTSPWGTEDREEPSWCLTQASNGCLCQRPWSRGQAAGGVFWGTLGWQDVVTGKTGLQ